MLSIKRHLPPDRLPASRLEHAIGLATIAEYLVLTHPGALATSPHLTVTRHPGAHGIMVWEAKHGRCMLHVDAQGTVYTYRPGPWERHLCALVEGLGRSAQPITFLVDAQRLQAAATWLAQYGAPYNPLEELGHLALRAAQGASREEQPCTT